MSVIRHAADNRTKMRRYWRADGWYKILGMACGLAALLLASQPGRSPLPWAEIAGAGVLCCLLRRRRVTVLTSNTGEALLAHVPGESLLVILILRHGPEAAAMASLLANILGVLVQWRYFMGEPKRVLGTVSNTLWLPFLAYVRGYLYYHWGGIALHSFADCQRLFHDPRSVMLPLVVATLVANDVLNRAMQGATLRLLYRTSWRQAFGTPTLFQHLEDAGAVLALTLWVTWGWESLPVGLVVMESKMLVGREWTRRQEARRQATSDPLTGLRSARGLSERIAELLLRRHHFAVLYFDLDEFKRVNDDYGHQAGDELLRCFADLLRESIGSADIAARRGGDEFVVVLKERNRRDAELLVARLRERLDAPVQSDVRFRKVSFSVGIAQAPGDGLTEQALLDAADIAMYADKRARKRAHAAA